MIRERRTRSRVVIAAMAIALAITSLGGPPAQAASTSFRDVLANHKFYTEISWMTSARVTTGYADATFRPLNNVSREAFAAFLYRLAGQPAVSLPSRSPFTDVSTNAQFYREIVWLDKQGITTGWADGTFRPKEAITREAMAAFLYRFEGRPGFTAPSRSPFTDMTPRSKFYKEVTWLADTGMTTGWADGTFRPKANTSREATSAFLFRGYAPSSYRAPAWVAPDVPYKPAEVLEVAHSQVGYKEPAWRTNKYNDWINGDYAWCHVYVAWVFEKAGYSEWVPKEKHYDTYVRKLRESGVLDTSVRLSELNKGDVVLVDWPPYNGPTHTGIVDHVSGNGVWLVEGNTTSGTGSADRGVFYRWRHVDYIYASYDPEDYFDATR